MFSLSFNIIYGNDILGGLVLSTSQIESHVKSCGVKVAVGVIIALLFGVGIGATIIYEELDPYRIRYYKWILWDVYNDYVVAMRDIEAATNLLEANYYAQYLPQPYKGMWEVEGPSPQGYVNDAMEQLDEILEELTKTDWPEEFRDEVTQLQIYVGELRQIVLNMQEIVSKSSYTEADVDRAKALENSFENYNMKIYNLIKDTP